MIVLGGWSRTLYDQPEMEQEEAKRSVSFCVNHSDKTQTEPDGKPEERGGNSCALRHKIANPVAANEFSQFCRK
jgi:hypothetical protein